MKNNIKTGPLIRTKLHRPPVAREHVHRKAILDHLNQQRHRPLVLVSASAGYGKSTLISSWLKAGNTPNDSVSLDKHDNDLRIYLSYFITAIQTMFPVACKESQAMLGARDIFNRAGDTSFLTLGIADLPGLVYWMSR